MVIKIVNALQSLMDTLGSVPKILLRSSFSACVKATKSLARKELIVLGNGPSLKESLNSYPSFLQEHDCLVVNAFSLSAHYEDLKPLHYVMADYSFWIPSPTPTMLDFRKSIFNAIVEKTSWKINLFLPYQAKRSKQVTELPVRNANINLVFYNKTTVKGVSSFRNWIFKLSLGMPRPQNVLIPAVMLSIWLGYKKVVVFGADHSWHENLYVDEENKVYITHKHFTLLNEDLSQKRPLINTLTKKTMHMHDQFEAMAIIFKGYFAVNEFAKKQECSILNASAKSYIDAFERILLND